MISREAWLATFRSILGSVYRAIPTPASLCMDVNTFRYTVGRSLSVSSEHWNVVETQSLGRTNVNRGTVRTVVSRRPSSGQYSADATTCYQERNNFQSRRGFNWLRLSGVPGGYWMFLVGFLSSPMGQMIRQC
jgi:hypothetical protein